MPHPEEKKRRLLHNNDAVAAISEFLTSLDDLGVDVLANIYAFLSLTDIMSKRRINKKSREAVKKTIVPLTNFVIDSLKKYENMRVMTRAMPNLQQITIGNLGGDQYVIFDLFATRNGHKWSDGEDPNEEVARRHADADWTSHDIEIISSFSKLQILHINYAPLNGRYPVFFNSFPLLQKLTIRFCHNLKWDLEMLAGFPLLKELDCQYNRHLTGNISSLRVLKTLVKVTMKDCPRVEGNFMDLANFPHLKELNLEDTAVTGDIRDIGETDFSSLEQLILPKEVYGISGCELQRVSDAPELVRAVYLLKKQRPALINIILWYSQLSRDSPDWYESVEDDEDYINPPPFLIQFVTAGSRVGYRWRTRSNPCEVNWLDPEPDSDSSDYEIYSEELQKIENEVRLYRGFRQPPTEEEYRRLTEG
jgi:hypothetical protein